MRGRYEREGEGEGARAVGVGVGDERAEEEGAPWGVRGGGGDAV